MRGFKSFTSAERFCRGYDELRNFLRPRTRHNQHVPADRRRLIPARIAGDPFPQPPGQGRCDGWQQVNDNAGRYHTAELQR